MAKRAATWLEPKMVAMTSSAKIPSRRDNLEHALGFDEAHDVPEALARLEIGEHERPLAAHPLRIAVHHFERGPHHRREIALVDHEEIALRDAGPALAGDLVARRDVDYVEREIGQL